MDSNAKEIHQKVHDSMQNIWLLFCNGVQYLYDFVVCLYEPIWNEKKLQTLSEDACKQISLAEEEIANGQRYLNLTLSNLLKERKKMEEKMAYLKSQIESLSKLIGIKKNEIANELEGIQDAEQDVQKHERKKNKAKTKATLTKFVTGLTVIVGSAAAATATVFTGGLAAPAAAAGVAVAVSGVSAIATGVTHKKLVDVNKALNEKKVALQERQNDLTTEEKKMKVIESKHKQVKLTSDTLEKEHKTLLIDSKVIAKLNTCVCFCHDFINITSGRAEILSEEEKKEFYKETLCKIMNDIINHLSSDHEIGEFSKYKQQVKAKAIEIRRLMKEPFWKLIDIKKNEEEISCLRTRSCVFHCCICNPFFIVRSIFCGFRNFRI